MPSASSAQWPASGGARPAQVAEGCSYSVLADGETRRRIAIQVAPWDPKHQGFHYWKPDDFGNVRGARVDMKRGEWNKDLLKAEVDNHQEIESCDEDSSKLINSKAEKHECDTNFHCVMRGNYKIVVGYSRYNDKGNVSHGWVTFAKGCDTPARQIQAVVTMLNLMGFEAPARIDPPGGGTAVDIPLVDRAPNRKAGCVPAALAAPAIGGSAKQCQPHCPPPERPAVPPASAVAAPAQVPGQAQPAAPSAQVHGQVQPATGGPAPAVVVPAQVPPIAGAAAAGPGQAQPAAPPAQVPAAGGLAPAQVPPIAGAAAAGAAQVVTKAHSVPQKLELVVVQPISRLSRPQSLSPRPRNPEAEEPATGGGKEEQDAAAQAEEASGVHEQQEEWTEEEMRVGVCVWWVDG